MIQITLHEHETWPDTNEEDQVNQAKEIGKRLAQSQNELEIIEKINNEKEWFTIDPLTTGIRIKASKFIGTHDFKDSGFKLRIIPKIFEKDDDHVWKNTTAIIDFTDRVKIKNIAESQRIYFEKNIEPTLFDHICRKLVDECDKLLRRGLLRSYVVHAENTKSLRGKLLLQHQILNDAMCKPQFFSEYDELEYNNLENQIILEALTVAEKLVKDYDLKMRTLRLAQQFSSVVEKISTSKYERNNLMQSYTRQNAHYENIHSICDLVIERSGISDIYHGNHYLVMPFFVDMNKIFERFVERLFEDYYEDKPIREIGTQKGKKAWERSESSDKKMIPDIIITNYGKVSTIIDAKYKKSLEESDLYQIGFYMHEYGLDKDINAQKTLDEAFAILPKYSKNLKDDISTATISRKKIYQRRIDMTKILQYIREQNPEGILEKTVEKLLEMKS